MRKIKLYIATSFDQFIAREDGSVDWLFTDGDYGYQAFYDSLGITLMGRKTYEQVLSFGGPFPYPTTTNYVFTSDDSKSDNEQVIFINEDIVEFARELKATAGKDIWLIGGGQLNTLFLENQLIDELLLFVHPIFLGKGIPLFSNLDSEHSLKLLETKPYENGLVLLRYAC